jgi:hypothetical protein
MTIGLIDAVANDTLDLLLGTAGLLPGTVYIGLMLSAPLRDGTSVVEPVGNGYARVAVVNNLTQWPAAAARRKTHANDIVFPTASGAWGTLTHFGIFDSASAGALLIADALSNPRTVNATDIFRFQAGVTPISLTV